MLVTDWGAVIAGMLALAAAWWTVRATRSTSKKQIDARCRTDRNDRSIGARALLAGSRSAQHVAGGRDRLYVELLINTREMLKRLRTQFIKSPNQLATINAAHLQVGSQRDLRDLIVLQPPIVYPAAVDRLGLIARPRPAEHCRVLRDHRTVQYYDEDDRQRANAGGLDGEL
jgi:hypothetical protein